MNKLLLALFSVVLLLNYALIQGQSTYVPLGSPAYHFIDRIEIKTGAFSNYLHTSAKPYNRFFVALHAEDMNEVQGAYFRQKDRFNQYYLYKDNSEWTTWGLIKSKRPIFKKLYEYKADFLFTKVYSDFLIKVNPVFHFSMGSDFGDSDNIQYINSKGLSIRGLVSEKLGFHAFVTDNQVSVLNYVKGRYLHGTYAAVPNEGRFKLFSSSVSDSFAEGVDYYSAKGYITYQPIERIRMQFGYDKNFIGNGIRSLFLSDFSANHLFLKVNTKVWKFNYQNLFMQLIAPHQYGLDQLLPTKYASMHHLSFNVTKWLNIGAFESVVFDRENGFELHYLNPVMFYRAVEFQLGSPDNVLLGIDWKVNFLRHFSFYGQFMLDEFRFSDFISNNGWWGNKNGFQLGLKYIDVFNVSNLDWQLEYNQVRPYAYTHHTAAGNYTHFNQPLAHPLGANFREILTQIWYQPRPHVYLQTQLLYAQYGNDTATENWGHNILLLNSENRPQDYDNQLLQGNKTEVWLANITLSWMNKQNLFWDLNYTYRQSSSQSLDVQASTHFIGLGMRLNMYQKSLLF